MRSIYGNLAFIIFSLSLTTQSFSQTNNNKLSFDIFTAELGHQGNLGCQPHGDQCLLFTGDGPIASDVQFSFKIYAFAKDRSICNGFSSTDGRITSQKPLRGAWPLTQRSLVFKIHIYSMWVSGLSHSIFPPLVILK